MDPSHWVVWDILYNNDKLESISIRDNESLDEGKDSLVINDNFKNKNDSDSNGSKKSEENNDYHSINCSIRLRKFKNKI